MKNQTRRNFILGVATTAGLAATPTTAATASGNSDIPKDLGANCGKYCGACPVYIDSINATSPADVKCLGCKSDVLADGPQKCLVRKCSRSRGNQSCGQCSYFPCGKASALYKTDAPEMAVAKKNNQDVAKYGYEKCLSIQPSRWQCKKCGANFSTSDEKCPRCNADVVSCSELAKG